VSSDITAVNAVSARRKSRKVPILVGIAAVLVIGVVVAVNVTRDSRSRVAVQTQKVARRDIVSTVTASGEIKPKRYVNVSSDIPGRIVKLFVREGDPVKQGQPLCRIDATRYEASMRGAEAALQASRADLRRAAADLAVSQAAFERTKAMFADQLVSAQAFDQAEADLKMRQAAVDAQKRRIAQTEAAAETDRDNLTKTTVASPMTGVVTLLQKEEGETVAGTQFSPTVIMTVADLSVMEVEILVDETDIKDLRLGQAAQVRVDALPDTKVKGEVTEIGASALVRGAVAGQQTPTNSGNQAKDFKVTVTIQNPSKDLRPGLNATADIETAKKSQVVAVPIQAVVVRELGKDGKVVDPGVATGAPQASGQPTPSASPKSKGTEREGVFAVVNGKAVFRAVKTGVLGESDIEILDGLKEGEEIVTGSYKTLRTLKNEAGVKVEQPKDKPRQS
jgi:HlyD family secretion protein